MASRSHKRIVPPLSKEAAALVPLTARFLAKRRRAGADAAASDSDIVSQPQAHRPTPAHVLRRALPPAGPCAQRDAVDEAVDDILMFLPMMSDGAGCDEESLEEMFDAEPSTEHASPAEQIDVRRRKKTGGTGGSTPRRGH